MKRLLWILPLLLVLAGVAWVMAWRSAPPELPVAQVRQGTLVDVLSTNGKVEPAAWTAVRAARAGKLVALYVQKGQAVQAGALLGQMEEQELTTALAAARAKLRQVEAEQSTLTQGGRPAELAEIASSLRRFQQQRETARKELEIAERLVAKQAAPAAEVRQWQQQVAQLETQMQGLEQRRAALVSGSDRQLYEGRVAEARAAVQAAEAMLAQSRIVAPMAGVVYQLEPKAGAYLNPGDLIANIGRVDTLQVNVYVDEPELGRVAIGQPVTITWDAFPQQKWEGRVERMPLQIQALGSRQVGEVMVKIANRAAGDAGASEASGEGVAQLPPGANINAAIRARTVERAVLLPKEALRRENGQPGVYVLAGEKLQWRPVQIGATNITEAQVTNGLQAGEVVVMATDVVLRNGMAARADGAGGAKP